MSSPVCVFVEPAPRFYRALPCRGRRRVGRVRKLGRPRIGGRLKPDPPPVRHDATSLRTRACLLAHFHWRPRVPQALLCVFAAVDWLTSILIFSNSPWVRAAPHHGLFNNDKLHKLRFQPLVSQPRSRQLLLSAIVRQGRRRRRFDMALAGGVRDFLESKRHPDELVIVPRASQ